ncbi:MAG: hypothetical protein AB7O37_07420 [Vicinamibacteria bacterium]
MSSELGPRLPADLVAFLRAPEPADKFRLVIPVTTLDRDGWPRHAQLSPWEIVARDAGLLRLLVYDSSRTCANLARDGRLSLLFLSPAWSLYVFAQARQAASLEEAPGEALFQADVRLVVEDVLASARLTSAVTYEGDDPGLDPERRRAIFARLLEA